MDADRELHRRWLHAHDIDEPFWPLDENPYTGLLLAALLDPDASSTTVRGLLAGRTSGATPSWTAVTAVQWPSRGADLVARLGECEGEGEWAIVVEHKRFRSPSHAPGYKKDPASAWQTDQLYSALTGSTPPTWLADVATGRSPALVVLDAYGKSMDQLFPAGKHNALWSVTSYAQLGSVLRAAHEEGVRGLVPLLATLYAGAP